MLVKIFLALLKIGTIGYGGGAATMPLMKKEFVEDINLITEDEFIEILAICNLLPGPLITKYCAVLGYRVKGIIGAIVCVIAIILPSCIMLGIILTFLQSQAEGNLKIENMINSILPVVSVILTLLTIDFFKMAKSKFNYKELFLLILIFSILLIGFKINVVLLIFALILISFIVPKREGE